MADGVVNFNALMMPDIAGSYMKGREYRDQRQDRDLQRQRQAEQDAQGREEFGLRKQEFALKNAETERKRPVEDAERLQKGMEVMAPYIRGINTPEDLERAKGDPGFLRAFQLNQQLTGDATPLDQITFDQINMAKQHLPRNLQGVNLGGGGYGAWDKDTGAFTTYREPTQRAPQGFVYGPDGELAVDPGYVRGRAQIAGATRAPPRPRAAGGGAPSGGAPSGGGAKPWERFRKGGN